MNVIRSLIILSVTAPLALTIVAPATAAPSEASLPPLLQSMAVEEKLARDVYLHFSETYGSAKFERIASSEQRHLTAVRAVMARYGISDPTAGDAVGQFDSAETTALYRSLIEDGEASLSSALKVGETIEEMDISDLKSVLATNPRTDVTRMLENLLNGSQRHLEAFRTKPSGQQGGGGRGGRA